MMRLKAVLILLFVSILFCSNAFAQSLTYGSQVEVEGILVSSMADPSITYDEKPHQFPALKLSKPISVACAQKERYCQQENDVTLLQLVLKKERMDQFKKLKGKRVKLIGSLFHSETGHHFTSVLLNVGAISPQPANAADPAHAPGS
ncbi:MAG: DUF4431 domain-containing protein [Parachlamydia sp.]|nr:DUF4431 domain-containing protein [Parachlamydia sp.]